MVLLGIEAFSLPASSRLVAVAGEVSLLVGCPKLLLASPSSCHLVRGCAQLSWKQHDQDPFALSEHACGLWSGDNMMCIFQPDVMAM